MVNTATTVQHVELWCVGQYRSGEGTDIVWEFQGVFDSKDKAIAACREPNYCVFPATLNEELPDSSFEMPVCEYPLSAADE